MWWWQSQAPAGALSFAGSVPEEFGTCWARLDRTETPAVDAASASIEAPLMKLRRAIMSSSLPWLGRPASSRFTEAVERLRILHQDAGAGRFVGRPLGHEVEQQSVVRLVVVGQARMRPVAPPHQALRRRLDEGLRDPGRLRIRGRADLAVRIGARQLDPGAAAVDEPAEGAMRGVLDARGQRRVGEMVEHERRRQTPQDVRKLVNLLTIHVELDVPAEIGDAFRE